MSTVRIEHCPDCGQMVGAGMLYEHQQRKHRAAKPQTCEWRRLPLSESFQPDCKGEAFDFAISEVEVELGAFKHCPYCGKPLTLAQEVEGQTS